MCHTVWPIHTDEYNRRNKMCCWVREEGFLYEFPSVQTHCGSELVLKWEHRVCDSDDIRMIRIFVHNCGCVREPPKIAWKTMHVYTSWSQLSCFLRCDAEMETTCTKFVLQTFSCGFRWLSHITCSFILCVEFTIIDEIMYHAEIFTGKHRIFRQLHCWYSHSEFVRHLNQKKKNRTDRHVHAMVRIAWELHRNKEWMNSNQWRMWRKQIFPKTYSFDFCMCYMAQLFSRDKWFDRNDKVFFSLHNLD